jgi:ornithine carbamoyltransferase
MAIQFTQNARTALLWAQEEAMRQGQADVGPHHLLQGLLHHNDNGAIRLLDRLGLSIAQVRVALSRNLGPVGGEPPAQTSQLGPDTKRIIDHAHAETEGSGQDVVGTDHLLMALVRHCGPGAVCDTLNELGITYDRLREFVGHLVPEPVRGSPPVPTTRSAGLDARPGFLRGRDLVSVSDLRVDEVRALFELTRSVKNGHRPDNAQNKTLALIFEKPSLRTRVTFSVAMTRLGGQSVYLSPSDIGLGTREPVADVARCLGRWVDAVAARTFAHAAVAELADNAAVPVINALTDREHPCQALADFYTILEHKSETEGMKLVYVGDGNNVASSLMLLAPRLGTHFTLACPPGYEPPADIVDEARAMALANNTRFEIVHDALQAADDADVLYTDVWASMGQENESEKRARDFAAFQINDEVVREAKEDVLVLHCLPAHRGQEIAASVLDGPQGAGVWDQAENRLHIQMALLAAVL